MNKWHDRFMNIAEQVAEWSKDPNCKVGCVVVSPDRRIINTGFNGAPANMVDEDKALNSLSKNKYMIHAEVNAILNSKTDLTGWTMYVTKSPCMNCSLMIKQSGITTLVAPKIYLLSKWARGQYEAAKWLETNGVEIIRYD